MKKLRTCLVFSIAVSVIFLITSPAFCRSKMAAESLVKTAKKHYDNHDYAKAIHEFSKALMADPQNEEAKYYLDLLGIEGGVYGRQETPLSRINHLVEDISAYQQAIKNLEEQRAEVERINRLMQEDQEYLQQVIRSKDEENINILQQMKEVQDESAQDKQVIHEVQNTSQEKSEQIARLNSGMYDLKSQLVEKMALADERDEQLRSMAKDLNKKIKGIKKQSKETELKYENQLLVIERRYNKLKHKATMESERNRKYSRDLRDSLRKERMRAGYSSDRMLFADYRLSGTERKLAEKDSQIFELRQSINDVTRELDYLQSKVETKRSGVQLVLKDSEEADDRAKLIKRQDELIAELKEKLSLLQEGAEDLERASQKGKGQAEIASLMRQLKEIQKQFAGTKHLLEEKNSDYEVLETRLKETQQRLGFVEGLMEDKDLDIIDLEKQLTDVLIESE